MSDKEIQKMKINKKKYPNRVTYYEDYNYWNEVYISYLKWNIIS